MYPCQGGNLAHLTQSGSARRLVLAHAGPHKGAHNGYTCPEQPRYARRSQQVALTRQKCARKGDSCLTENARVRPVDGVDVGRAQSNHRDGAPATGWRVSAVRDGSRRLVRQHRVAPKPCPRGARSGAPANRHPRTPPRPVKHGPDVDAALRVCWTALGMPASKRLAPTLNELVAVLPHFGELSIDEDTAVLLASMSAPSRDRCSRARPRCAPRPNGTTLNLDSSRSTWCGTTAVSGLEAMHLR
jgi:hypothetical protein